MQGAAPSEAAGKCSVSSEVRGGGSLEREVVCNYAEIGSSDSAYYRPPASDVRYRVSYGILCSVGSAVGTTCGGAAINCPDGADLVLRTVSAILPDGTEEIVSRANFCNLGAGSEPELTVDAEPPFQLTAEQVDRLGIVPATIGTEFNGFTLRNAHTNIWADADPQEFRETILGVDVQVRVRPINYRWSYGDGHTWTTVIPGGPLGSGQFDVQTETSHQYAETGAHRLALTTTFQAEYSADGGPWQAVVGTNSVASVPVTVDVWRTKKLLVDATCAEEPDGPYCDGPFDE